MDGISYVYNKGPAGQTPFLSLIAMPGYFPQGIHPQPQQQQNSHSYRSHQSNAGSHSKANAGHHQKSLQQQQTPYPSPPAQIEDDKGIDFWKHAYPQPSTTDDSRALTREQLQMWNHHIRRNTNHGKS
ncbi:hypothetical protein BGX23_009367 [Mortierella sp. AD031]|nr:hypothetical protein BGX23_009367 [Mortierella sp. AD031]